MKTPEDFLLAEFEAAVNYDNKSKILKAMRAYAGYAVAQEEERRVRLEEQISGLQAAIREQEVTIQDLVRGRRISQEGEES